MTDSTGGDEHAGYDAARASAAVAERGPRGWIRVSGEDAVSFLHGVLTNDIASLAPGHWRYAAYLTPQGRMLSDMRVLRRAGNVAVETEPQVATAIAARFDASIFTERVQVVSGDGALAGGPGGIPSAGAGSIRVCGPAAREAVASVLGAHSGVAQIHADGFLEMEYRGVTLVLVGHEELSVTAVDAIGPAAACAALANDLRRAGAANLAAGALEALRIEAGTPRFGVDMNEDTIPLEAGIEARAISMTKGCYVGQEVIIRILHRGHGRVARRLIGLVVRDSHVPAAGSRLAANEREVGWITSAAYSPRIGAPIALAYVQRDFVEPGTLLATSPAGAPAVVVRVPFTAD